MTININEKVIDRLLREGFYPNEMFSLYFALQAFNEGRADLLDKYDDINTSKRAVITYQTLFRKGLIERDGEGSKVYFRLSDKGINLLEELNPKVEETSSCKDWIQEWINLFPARSGNRALRNDKKDSEKRMELFIKKYKYNKDVIFAATKSYLMEQSAENFKFCKNTLYFIAKRDEGSTLATWCKLVQDKVDAGGSLTDGTRLKLIEHVN